VLLLKAFVNHRILKTLLQSPDYITWVNETILLIKIVYPYPSLRNFRKSPDIKDRDGSIKEWTMVGLKTFWILISALTLLSACVPQTKQTECKGNEAFNASLRTCVPVLGTPSSFINISSFTPQFTQTRYKDDPTLLTFSITVSNPYAQSYVIEWERVFNAGPVTMCSNTLSCSFPASDLGTVLGEIGTHILTAKIKDGNGSIVDSQSFELKINDFPKPAVNTATLNPATYAFDAWPTDPEIAFSFNIRNNNATIAALDNYRTVWTIVRNGSTLYTEVDLFTDFTLTGTNTAYLGLSPTPAFDPASLGVGSYIVRAVVQNDVPGEVVAEHQWNVIIKEPPLTNVTSIGQPAPGVTITAHNNVPYNAFPALSWVYGSPAAQPNFCVLVDDRDGTYPADGKSVQVRFYLDGLGGEVCSKKTLDTSGTQTICLIDANNCDPDGANLPFDQSLLVFSNANSTSPQTRKVTARLFDEATTLELQRANVIPSNGSYPIEWIVNNKPANTAPVITFGTLNPIGCTPAGSFTRSNCQVNQGTNFTVSFSVADDFYSPSVNPEEFQWNAILKYNGADLTTSDVTKNTNCSKAFGTAVTIPGASGPYGTQWTCTLAVPHHTSTGPLNPSVGAFQVLLTMQDSGSPVGGAGLPSQSLSWNLVVTETNSPIILAAQTTLAADSNISQGATVYDNSDTMSFATEKETVTFKTNVTDNEIDNLQYRISLCTDNTIACATSNVISSPAYINFIRSLQSVPDANPVLISALSYILPEDLLMTLGKNVDTLTSELVYFKVDVVDVPSVLTTVPATDSEVFSLYVRNFNPAPVINTATASPALNSTTQVYSGYQFTVDPGSVSDPSVPASERNLEYQWYSKIGMGAWTVIPGATQRILRYTPGNTVSTIDLQLCVGDGTAANPVSLTGTCAGNWSVTPVSYLQNLTATGSASLNNEVAVWYDDTNTVVNTQTIYSAYVDDNLEIFVEKTIKDPSGNIILSTNTISFAALPSGASGIVTNLSIAGSADSIYIAYIASSSAAPSTMEPRIRRIDKSFATGVREKTTLSHAAPFGFNYAHYTLNCITVTPGICTPANGDGIGGFASITFTDRLSTGDTIEINGEIFTASPAPAGANQVCDASACATVNSMAQNVANKINSSTLPALDGLTAVATGAIVEIYGQYALDFLDFNGTIVGVPGLVVNSGGLGRIVVSGNRWHLPMINASLGGAEQNNITVLSGATDVHMRNPFLALNSGDNLTEMGKVALFDNKLNAAGEMVFARISGELGDSGALSLFRYSLFGSDWTIFDAAGSGSATDRNQQDIMGMNAFEYVKLATDKTGNPFYYIIAKEQVASGGEWHIGRYNYELDSTAAVLEYFLTDKIATTDATDDVISNLHIQQPDIISVPGLGEARVFFHSVGLGATPFPRLARWKTDDTITCGTCFSLSGSLAYQGTARVGLSQVANSITFGSAGASAGENTNNVVFTLFSSDIASNGIYKPQLAIINVEGEAIQSTAVDATGMFQPPFILD
jgi:hypothetical protein